MGDCCFLGGIVSLFNIQYTFLVYSHLQSFSFLSKFDKFFSSALFSFSLYTHHIQFFMFSLYLHSIYIFFLSSFLVKILKWHFFIFAFLFFWILKYWNKSFKIVSKNCLQKIYHNRVEFDVFVSVLIFQDKSDLFPIVFLFSVPVFVRA